MKHIKSIDEFLNEGRIFGYRDLTPDYEEKLYTEFERLIKEKYMRLYRYVTNYLSTHDYEMYRNETMDAFMDMRNLFMLKMRDTRHNYTPEQAFAETEKQIEDESRNPIYSGDDAIDYNLILKYKD